MVAGPDCQFQTAGGCRHRWNWRRSEMISALFRRWRENARVEVTRLEAGEITVHVVPASNLLTVAVAGRSTVDSSPHLRSVLLGLLRRGTAPVLVIDASALSYLDMSGIATPLEALKAARERAVKRSEEHTSELQSLRHLVC